MIKNNHIKQSSWFLLGLSTSSVKNSDSIFVAGILIPLDKIEPFKDITVKNLRTFSKDQMYKKIMLIKEKFNFIVRKVLIGNIKEDKYKVNNLIAQTYLNIWNKLAINREKTIVYANLERIDFLNLTENWIIEPDANKKYPPCIGSYLLADFYAFNNETKSNYSINTNIKTIGSKIPFNLKTFLDISYIFNYLPIKNSIRFLFKKEE